METYSSPYGNTPQGQGVSNMSDILSQISGMAQQSGQDPSTAVQNAFTMGQNTAQPQAFQQATNQLTQQAGIPQLQNQQQNLGGVFQMWLADQNLAQKYASPQLTTGGNTPWTSGLQNQPQAGVSAPAYAGIQDPYLASPTAILNAVAGGGYQGATNPTQNTFAMGAVPNAAASVYGTLNNLIGTEQGLVNQKAGDYQTYYSNIMNALGSVLSNQAATSFATAQPGTAASVKQSTNNLISDIKSKMSLKSLMAKYQQDPNMTADKILQLYNSNSPWGPAKEDPTTLATTYGVTGGLGKATKYQSKKLPDGSLANYDPNTGKYYDPNSGKQLNMTDSQLQAAQDNLSAAQDMMSAYENMNPILRAATWIPGAGDTIGHLDPSYAKAQSALFQSLGSLRRGAIGGRITQQEITWLTQKLFPAPQDTTQTMQAKVDQLQETVSKFQSDPNAYIDSNGDVQIKGKSVSSGGGSSSKSDPLGIL